MSLFALVTFLPVSLSCNNRNFYLLLWCSASYVRPRSSTLSLPLHKRRLDGFTYVGTDVELKLDHSGHNPKTGYLEILLLIYNNLYDSNTLNIVIVTLYLCGKYVTSY